MNIKTAMTILMCSSAITFATVGTVSAQVDDAAKTVTAKMKDKAKDKAVDKAMDVASDKAADLMKGKAAKETAAPTVAPKTPVVPSAETSLKAKAADTVMDKAKGMAKDKVLGKAAPGLMGKAEHTMKEKAMDNAMDNAADRAKSMMGDKKETGAAMPEKAETVLMETPAVEKAAPMSKPAKLLTFDEALTACRGSANLQACVDERTGQGALRQQIHQNKSGG